MERFENILCVVPADPGDDSGLRRALLLADIYQARLTVAQILPEVDSLAHGAGAALLASRAAALQTAATQQLEAIVAAHRARIDLDIEVLSGTPFLAVIRRVLSHRHDLVIKTAEDPSFIARLFGSDDMHLLRKCPCPLWLTHPAEKANYATILATIDVPRDSATDANEALNEQILALASSLAVADPAELHVVHVWEAPGESTVRTWSTEPEEAAKAYVQAERAVHEEGMARAAGQLRGLIGDEAFAFLAPTFQLFRGVPKLVIPEVAKRLDADLVVMGTIARTGIAGFFIGNTAEAILEQLQCSVLAVKPPGFVSPVGLAA